MVFSPKNFSWAVWFHRFRLINVFLMVALFKGSQFMLSVWNDPFFRQNHWFKSLQFVSGYRTIYLFVMLHYIHCNLVWWGRSAAWSNQWWFLLTTGRCRSESRALPCCLGSPCSQGPRSQGWAAVLEGLGQSSVCLGEMGGMAEASFWRWWSLSQW